MTRCVGLLVTQRFDRIHVSGLASRVDSEDEPHAERNEQRQGDGSRRHGNDTNNQQS